MENLLEYLNRASRKPIDYRTPPKLNADTTPKYFYNWLLANGYTYSHRAKADFLDKPDKSYLKELTQGTNFFAVSIGNWKNAKGEDLPDAGEVIVILYNGQSEDYFYQINFWGNHDTEYLICRLASGASCYKKENYSEVEEYIMGKH